MPLDNTTAPMLQHTGGRNRTRNIVDALRKGIPRDERREMAAGCLDAPHTIAAGGMTQYLDFNGRFGSRFSWRHPLDCGAMARLVEIERISARRRDGRFPCWFDAWKRWAAHAEKHGPRAFADKPSRT